MELLDRPGVLVRDEAGQLQAIIGSGEFRHVRNGKERVVAKVTHDLALRKGGGQPLIAEQKRLSAVVPSRHQSENALHLIVVGNVTSGQQTQRPEAQRLAQKLAAFDAADHRFPHDDRISHSQPPAADATPTRRGRRPSPPKSSALKCSARYGRKGRKQLPPCRINARPGRTRSRRTARSAIATALASRCSNRTGS